VGLNRKTDIGATLSRQKKKDQKWGKYLWEEKEEK